VAAPAEPRRCGAPSKLGPPFAAWGRERLRPVFSSKVDQPDDLFPENGRSQIQRTGCNLSPGPSLRTRQHSSGGLPPAPGAAGADTRSGGSRSTYRSPSPSVTTGRRAEPDPGPAAKPGGRSARRATRAIAGPPRPAQRGGVARPNPVARRALRCKVPLRAQCALWQEPLRLLCRIG